MNSGGIKFRFPRRQPEPGSAKGSSSSLYVSDPGYLFTTTYYEPSDRNKIPVGPLTPLSSDNRSQPLCKTLCHRFRPIALYWPDGVWPFPRRTAPADRSPGQRQPRPKRRGSVGHPAGLTHWERGSWSGPARQRSGIIAPPHCGAAQPVEAPANSQINQRGGMDCATCRQDLASLFKCLVCGAEYCSPCMKEHRKGRCWSTGAAAAGAIPLPDR